MSTIARVKHRSYVYFDHIAITFCDIEFSGNRQEEFDNAWHKIEHETIKHLKKSQFFDTIELIVKAESFLKRHGFILNILDNSQLKSAKCITVTNTWKLK